MTADHDGDSPKDHGDPLASDVLAEEAPRVLRARARRRRVRSAT